MEFFFKVPNWFHFGCFFNKRVPLGDVAEISGFTSLRWDDQEKIKTKVLGGVSKKTQGGSGAETCEVDAGLDTSLKIEYAKSSRSSCHACEEKIEKVYLLRFLNCILFYSHAFRSYMCVK